MENTHYSRTAGFTLLEMLIAVALIIIVVGATVPLVADYYRYYRVVTAQQDLASVLRKAQARAMVNQFESSFGVYVDPAKYIIFKGDSYASRDSVFDDDILYADAVTVSGTQEVIFSRLSGRPSASGTISITEGKYQRSVTINEEGRISW